MHGPLLPAGAHGGFLYVLAMSASEQKPTSPQGQQSTPCEECQAPLAGDQRYCLNCGHRQGSARVDLAAYFGTGQPNGKPASQPASAQQDYSPWTAVVGV